MYAPSLKWFLSVSLQTSRLRTALVLAAYLAAGWIVSFGHVHMHGHGETGDHACVPHTHSHCHHDHDHHDHGAQRSAADESAPNKAPVHDDDCAACQFLLYAVAYLDTPPQLVRPHHVEAFPLDESLAVAALAPQAHRSRGPPPRS